MAKVSRTERASFGKDWLIGVALPQLNEARTLANVLDMDIALAREQHNGERVISNLMAMLRLAGQLRESNDFLVTGLVSIGIGAMALDQLDRTLATAPDLFNDSELQAMAHLLAGPQHADQLLPLQGERLYFYDLVQRAYTDDGQGDGRITMEGIDLLSRSVSRGRDESTAARAIGPLMASRRALLAEYDHFMNQAEANFKKSMYETDWPSWEREFRQWRASLANSIRFAPLRIFLPSLNRAQNTSERYLGQRDGILTALALEAYHRKNGSYPATLEALVPILLPTLPTDRMNGQPLHYKLVGHPLIYSVGSDGDDDGGRPPVDKWGDISNSAAAEFPSTGTHISDGDWILFPRPRLPVAEPD